MASGTSIMARALNVNGMHIDFSNLNSSNLDSTNLDSILRINPNVYNTEW